MYASLINCQENDGFKHIIQLIESSEIHGGRERIFKTVMAKFINGLNQLELDTWAPQKNQVANPFSRW